jgi:Zn-dependent protease with chaperone function
MHRFMLPLVATLLLGAPGEKPVDQQNQAFDARLLAQLETVAPAAVAEARSAGEAYRAGRWQAAFDGYGRVLVAAPHFSHALRRQCNARLALGDRAGAIVLCRRAVAEAATPENEVTLAYALSTPGGKAPASPEDLSEAARGASRVFEEERGDLTTNQMVCQVALRVRAWALADHCATRLQALAPGEQSTEYFGIFGALIRKEFGEARRHLAAARVAGLDPRHADALATLIDQNEPPLTRWGWPALMVLAFWAALLLLLLATGALLSRLTLRGARAMATERGQGGGSGALLRRVYAAVLWLTCTAYYLSLPIVLLAVLGGAVGLFMAFEALGQIPVKLLLVVAVVALVSVWAVLKSLWVSLIRPRTEDPGLPLDVAAHPRFAAALEQAATRVGTRQVDRVFLTPGTDAAVFERGGLAAQVAGRSERCLILGLGLLDGMTQGGLKAVLAHEYGHFVNRDTAGGGLALAVRRSVLEMGMSLAKGGAATWYNPAWHFVNGFHRLFLRVSQGASRLQEILADRWAALAYGGRHFAAGLSHAVTASVRFDHHAGVSLKEVVDRRLALRNLYQFAPSTAVDEQEVAAAVKKAMEAEPSPYDSHPRPVDRIAWVGDVAALHSAELDVGAPAWALFSDREALERLLTDQVRANVAAKHGVQIPAEPLPTAAAAGEPVAAR